MCFRKIVEDYGMFYQVRTDCGKEFYLTLGMQEMYSHLRNRDDIRSYQQTQSKKVNFLLTIHAYASWVEENKCCWKSIFPDIYYFLSAGTPRKISLY